MKKQWVICGSCQCLYKCKAGKAKLINVNINSPVYNEIGCFDYEQASPRQIKLF